MDKKQKVTIQTTGAGVQDIDKLSPFQGKLKELPDENYEKFKARVLELGVSEPINVWKHKGKLNILNGNTRLKMLLRMREEGYVIPKIPVNYTKAKSFEEAKKKLFSMVSQYGVVTYEGVQEQAALAKLTLEELMDQFEIPEIDRDELQASVEAATEEIEKSIDRNRTGERFEVFKNATIKQIVLFFPEEEYDPMIAKLDKLMEAFSVEDYTAVVTKLVNDAQD